MSLRVLPRAFALPLRGLATRATCPRTLRRSHIVTRGIRTTPALRDRSFTNLLADDVPPPVQVSSITDEGIILADGLLLPGACIFHDGHVFLWDVPPKLWEEWTEARFEFFEAIVPRPEIIVLGTGRTSALPPPFLRSFLTKLGIQLEVMDTRNACSTYNLLSEEGRHVAAALMPLTPRSWQRSKTAEKESHTPIQYTSIDKII
ncbi:DUF498-domain-containing protein [Macrolepiota fuliginosa MF-IS2]|uniref:NADH dehydrogenase [ubiquinone] 1 alpha subcomplex assembly factor 3 n=1 Tax=Macrolepiota fuliginosa MF-IS2 TaxID=1400762 RepID=A0A9P6C3J4_9AGAR|nr:DUF498-domain-containing protein [Macrolepiota fuliginosa MF-IS2]